ncbi:hypothetical protein K450DRAFT_289692 [Umbelopsis ramanniana AG]|uniref:Uncharacterized protein n=1 Tax=Umbelopsis ramanniana AG TaxID=1314678 RepID=A0AAD5E6N0_UMBRA|nr:uncharacterized protein K450DRAFT_289692 [Umbelopsis ramanniana AG]KAI8577867.1 hypothetical protein K450DRAFT_289692 [Umbelopsis ramanniana AG]
MPVATLSNHHSALDFNVYANIFTHLPDSQSVNAFRIVNKSLFVVSQSPSCIAAHLIQRYGPLFALHALITVHTPLLQRFPKIPARLLELGARYPRILAQRIFQGYGGHKGLPKATITLLLQNAEQCQDIIHTNDDDQLLLDGMLTHLSVTEQEFGDSHPGFIGMQQALLRQLPGYYPLPGPEYYGDERVHDRIQFLFSHSGNADMEKSIFRLVIYCPRALAVLARNGFSVSSPLDISLFMVRFIRYGLEMEKKHFTSVSLRIAVRQLVRKLVIAITAECLEEIIETMARVYDQQQEDLNRIVVVIDDEIVCGNSQLQPVVDQFYQHIKRKSWWRW